MPKGLDIAYAIRKKNAKKMNSGGMVPVPREKNEDPRKANMAAVAEQARNGGSSDQRSFLQRIKDSVDPEKAKRYADGGEIPEDNTDPGNMNSSPNVPSLPAVTPAYNVPKEGGKEGGGGGDMMGMAMKMAPMIAAMASDENGKENIEGADEDMDDFLSAIEPESYDYKNPQAPGAEGGRQYGVMAQDLERSKAGSSVVDDSDSGKMINSTRALGVTMGALGRLASRVKNLESMRKFAGGGEVEEQAAKMGGDQSQIARDAFGYKSATKIAPQKMAMGGEVSDEDDNFLSADDDEPMGQDKRKRLISKAFEAVRRRQTGC